MLGSRHYIPALWINTWNVSTNPVRKMLMTQFLNLTNRVVYIIHLEWKKNMQLTHAGKRSATMLAAKRSAGVTLELNLREHISCMPPPSPNKAAHSGFETQRRHHQKSKTGVSVAPQKGLMSSKICLKKEYMQLPQFLTFPYVLLKPKWYVHVNTSLSNLLIKNERKVESWSKLVHLQW